MRGHFEHSHLKSSETTCATVHSTRGKMEEQKEPMTRDALLWGGMTSLRF